MIVKNTPIEKTFHLKADESGEAYVKFRQATLVEDMQRGDFYTTRRTEYPTTIGEKVVIVENRNAARAKIHEIWLTMSGAGGFSDERGKDVTLFIFEKGENGLQHLAMSETELTAAFAKLGVLAGEVIDEMYDDLLELNPTWGTPRSKQQEEPKHGEEKRTPEGESKTTSEE